MQHLGPMQQPAHALAGLPNDPASLLRFNAGLQADASRGLSAQGARAAAGNGCGLPPHLQRELLLIQQQLDAFKSG